MNMYFDKMLEAENDRAALDAFSNGVESGAITGAEESFYGNRTYITFEEVDRNATTKIDIGKTSVGVQMGQQSVGTRESNSWHEVDRY